MRRFYVFVKKIQYEKITFFITITMLTACSKEENNCSSCHIVIYQESNAYYLTDLEEFCNEELINAQNEGYLIYDTIYTTI
mgnify:CR=1 FL=1